MQKLTTRRGSRGPSSPVSLSLALTRPLASAPAGAPALAKALAKTLVLALGLTLACSDEKPAPATPQAATEKAAAPAPDAPANAATTIELPSGLILTMTQAGSGPSPGPTDTVRVHYHGTFPDGSVFDSSVNRGQPSTFPLNRVIPCWTEGLQLLQVGAKASLVCPPAIAYGPRGRPPKIPANSTLHFDVELLGIQ